jgi:multiple sugar transport system permease protein
MESSRIKHFLIAPPLFMLLALSVIPLLLTVGLSLTSADIAGQGGWVGLANYQRLLADPIFIRSYLNTLIYVAIGLPIQYALGLGLALLVHGSPGSQRLWRLIIPVPLMVAPLVVGFIWKTLLDSRFGPMNHLLSALEIAPIPWIIDARLAFISILIVDTWQWTPFIFLILYAGLRTLPIEPFEAARVDGASRWRIFWDITFPMLLPASVAAIMLRAIEAFKLFDIVFYITGGGPGSATSTVTLDAYFTGLRSGYVGYGGAMAVVLFVTVAVFATALPLAIRFATHRRNTTLKMALMERALAR